MELMISIKGNKYTVTDKKQSRLLYTIKKKAFSGGRYLLLDASNYQLYTIIQVSDDRKPKVKIIQHVEWSWCERFRTKFRILKDCVNQPHE